MYILFEYMDKMISRAVKLSCFLGNRIWGFPEIGDPNIVP